MKTKRVVFLNGPMGAGKTTVGRLVQQALPGCAFIDGDWCMDLEPFVGNSVTRAMAVDNILHMLSGYRGCPHCQDIVVAWLMDRAEVCRALEEGAADAGLKTAWFTLLCSESALSARWRGDKCCPWRTEENLDISIRSLEGFSKLPGTRVDTSGMTAEQVCGHILKHLSEIH